MPFINKFKIVKYNYLKSKTKKGVSPQMLQEIITTEKYKKESRYLLVLLPKLKKNYLEITMFLQTKLETFQKIRKRSNCFGMVKNRWK